MDDRGERVLRLLREEEGQSLIEYVLIGSLISLAVVVALTNLQTQIRAAFSSVTSKLSAAM